MGLPAGKPGAAASIKQLAPNSPFPGKAGSPTSFEETGMTTGTVVWFSEAKGYGFIRPEGAEPGGGEDVFVHYTGIVSASKRRNLLEGQRVEYELIPDGDKGPYATNVRVVT